MSGGSFDYKYCILEEYYVGNMEDDELNDLVKDLVNVLYELEWWTSGDTNEEKYRITVRKFKEKWFKQNRSDRLKNYIDEKITNTKKELYNLIGLEEIN